jgi:hypothetical protein
MAKEGFVVVIVVLIFASALGALLYTSHYGSQTQIPASLTFSATLPNQIIVGQTLSGSVAVTSNGADAHGVAAVAQSDGISGISDQYEIKTGSSVTISMPIVAKDVADGKYSVSLFIQYSDNMGSHQTSSQEYTILLLPNVDFNNVRFMFDILQPFGKSKIGKTDSTAVLFKVQSHSNKVIYEGITARVSMSISVPGLAISPPTLSIDAIGPTGTSGDYSFTIKSNSSPPGSYDISIGLYSKSDVLIVVQTVTLVITG